MADFAHEDTIQEDPLISDRIRRAELRAKLQKAFPFSNGRKRPAMDRFDDVDVPTGDSVRQAPH